ncbi:MAG: hypothetical protein HYX21_00080 [Candidatus Yanofskybacteria bacterium]|nr:hypothetical protein [Candidatus Yanofskybacteria bacterium]
MLKNPGLWLLVFLLVVNIVFGFVFDFYLKFWFFDFILHFSGGLGVALFARYYFAKDLKNISKFGSLIFLVSFGVAVGVFWEFLEYGISIISKWTAGSLNAIDFFGEVEDTISDLAMDTLGAFVVAILHLFGQRNAEKS